ncbi:MAG: Ig-like domain-containing protein [Saprospiraceae bacterium]
MSRLTLLLLFSLSTLSLQAQDWELIYEENFGTGYTGQPLPQFWVENIFNGTTEGATGGEDDPCRSSLLRFYSAFLAYQMNLSDTYEYYVSLNVKTDDPAGAELVFYHNTIAEAEGTAIGNPALVPNIPSNQPGQVISSAIFGDLNGAHYFIIAKGPNDPSSGDEKTRVDDFKLYRRPIGGNNAPTISLTQPVDGATYLENEAIALSATASDSDGSIQSVKFYQGATLISEDLTSPYEATLSNGLAAGSYTLKAVATDNDGATSEDQLNITVNPDSGGGGPSDWELIYEENFGTGYTGQPLPQYWVENIFNGTTEGATGGEDDPCRSSLLRFYSAFLAYQMNLSDTYEYYVSLNVKTDDPAGAELAFYHNTIAEAEGTAIGNPALVPNIPSNQPGQVISSAIFGDLNGAHYFIIAKGPNDPSSGDEKTRVDDFKLYRRPIGGTNAPTISLTQPVDGATYLENEAIALSATASDSDGSIQSVKFYQGPTLISEDLTFPYEATLSTGLAAGNYTLKAVATDNDGATSEDQINITVNPDSGGNGEPVSVCVKVNGGSNDAEERPNGNVNRGGAAIELINDGIYGNQTIGLRFQSLNIPPGANITNAYIQFTVSQANDLNPCQLSIFGEASDNPSNFLAETNNITNRPLTNASVTWSPAAWSISGVAGADQQTVDIAPVIQEIVNREGYTANSAIAIIISGTGRRTAVSFNGNAEQAPALCVSYGESTPPVTPTVVFQQTNLSMDEGSSTQVCLSISEAPTAEASVQVALSGNASPHFTSYSTTTVTFPIGNSTSQCFTLNSNLGDNGPTPLTYTFQLQNITNAQLGTPEQLSVTVTGIGDTSCPYAGEDRTICQGETTQIGCEPDPENPSPYCFKWEPEIGFVDEFGPMQESPTVKPAETTTYTLYVTDGNGSLIAEEEVVVTVEGEMSKVEIIMCEGAPVQLTALVEGEGNFIYNWNTGSTETSIQAAFSGTYSVTVSNESNCEAVATIEVPDVLDPTQNATQIKEYFKNKGFFVLPIAIIGDDDPPVLIGSPNPNARSLSGEVEDHANKIIQLKDETFNIASLIDEFLQDEFYADFTDKKAYITKNENFCELVEGNASARLVDEIEHNFMTQEFGYWIHLWENPGEGGDCLLIACKTPTVEGLSPANPSKVTYLSSLLAIVEGETNNTYGYASKDRQLLAVTFDNLADFYEADLTADFLDQGQSTVPDPNDPLSGGPCGVEVTTELICLNSAGLPITVPEGYTPFWSAPADLRGNFDPKALVAFSGGGNYYVSYFKTSKLTGKTFNTGFKNQKAPHDKYPFPDLNNECRAVYFGTVSSFTAIGQESCVNINATPAAYKTTILYDGNVYRTGEHQPDFDAKKDQGGSNCEISDATSYVYNSCIPHITKAAFDKAKHTAVFNPFGNNSKLKGGILFRYEKKELIDGVETVTGEKWIFGHFRGLDPGSFTYFIWECENGRWREYTPEDEKEVEDMPFLAALFGAVLVTLDPEKWKDVEIGSDTWHTALDAVGFLPVVGSVADFVNGVYYIAEGNYGEGLLTLVGAIPLAGDAYQLIKLGLGDASKYALKVNIGGVETVLDAKSLGRYRCLTSIGFNSTNLSINAAISSLFYFPPDCDGVNSFKNNFDPSGLLAKAAKEGATNLDELATKGLIDWLNIAIKEDAFIGKAFEKYPDLIKVWKQADFSAFPDEKKKELLSWLGKLDPAKADELAVVNKFLERPELVRAWGGLFNTGLRKDIPWLTRASKWLDEGAEFAADGSGKLTKNGEDILQIKNDKILPDKYDFDPSTGKPKTGGTEVGDAANGYQVYKHGDDISVRRVPETSGYSQSEVDFLTELPDGHALHRHGPDVTDDALIKRATTGIAPDGAPNTLPVGQGAIASKFSSEQAVKDAIENVKPNTSAFNAKELSVNPITGEEVWIVEAPGNYGYGFKANGAGGQQQMLKVTAVYKEMPDGSFKLITMYPNK